MKQAATSKLNWVMVIPVGLIANNIIQQSIPFDEKLMEGAQLIGQVSSLLGLGLLHDWVQIKTSNTKGTSAENREVVDASSTNADISETKPEAKSD